MTGLFVFLMMMLFIAFTLAAPQYLNGYGGSIHGGYGYGDGYGYSGPGGISELLEKYKL